MKKRERFERFLLTLRAGCRMLAEPRRPLAGSDRRRLMRLDRRVREHLEQRGRRPSKLVGAALAVGRQVTLVGTLEGDRAFERQLKARGSAVKYCPACRVEYNARAAERMRARRAEARALAERGFGPAHTKRCGCATCRWQRGLAPQTPGEAFDEEGE